MPLAPFANAPARQTLPSVYGAASKYDFDNPSKWVTEESVPVLDEHELDGDNGEPAGYVDRSVLEEIAANNNKRVIETGDPAPLIIGHTSDNPNAPERPVVGYAVNYRVKPFKRDKLGQTIYAIHADYKVRKDREHVINDYPRRSVELWLSRKELDPIALLGGTTPERDLGVVVRKSRFAAFCLNNSQTTPKWSTQGQPVPTNHYGPVIKYSARRGTVLLYEMGNRMADTTPSTNGKMPAKTSTPNKVKTKEDAYGGDGAKAEAKTVKAKPNPYVKGATNVPIAKVKNPGGKTNPTMPPVKKMSALPHASHGGMKGMKARYSEDEMVQCERGDDEDEEPCQYEADLNDDRGTEDIGGGGIPSSMTDEDFGEEEDNGMNPHANGPFDDQEPEEDPVVAKVLSSRSFRDMLKMAMTEAIEGLLEQEGGGAGGGGEMGGAPMGGEEDGVSGGMPMGEDGEEQGPPMTGTDGLAPGPDEEARIEHEPPPVKFGASTGFAGPNSGFVPTTGEPGTMGKRYAHGQPSSDISSSKAKQILKDGEVRGHPLSEKQKGMFGAAAGRSKMSRNSNNNNQPSLNGNRSHSMPATQQSRPTRNNQQDSAIAKLSRVAQTQSKQIGELRLKLARAEAEQTIQQLMQDGIVINDPEAEIELLSTVAPESAQYHVEEVIKKNYARRTETDPANGSQQMFGLTRFARAPEGSGPATDDDYEPTTPEEAVLIADITTGRHIGKTCTYGEAVKYARDKGMIGAGARRPARR